MSRKIPKRHIDNMNKLKDIIRKFEYTNIVEFETMCNEYIRIYNKLPQYLRNKDYLLDFYNNCYNFISYIHFVSKNMKEVQKRFLEFDERMKSFSNP